MPAKNPVLKVVLPRRVVETVARLARAAEKSQSAVVREFLVEAEPTLRRVAGLLEVANAEAAALPAETRRVIDAAVDRLSGNADAVLDLLASVHAEATRSKPAKRVGPRKAARPKRRTPAV